MIQNYLKLAIRNLSKNKFHSTINILGLAIGLVSCLLIFLYVADELSYDRFYERADSIYRVNWDYKWNDTEGIGPGTPPPLAATLVAEMPEVKAATRIYPISDRIVRFEDKFFNDSRILGVDANFFEIFTLEMLAGNPATALAAPNSVVLTRQTAEKYFGTEPALGKIITIGKDDKLFSGAYSAVFKVTGVVEALPHNSHFQFDLLTSMSSHPHVAYFDWSWVWMQVVTYVVVEDATAIPAIESRMPAMVKRHAQKTFKVIGTSYDELIASGGRWNFVLQPLTDIYLGSANIGNRLGPVGNRLYVYLFSVIALFVLLIACINFMNLSTARSANRAKEVGVRKVLGSERRTLIMQFVFESMLFSFLAMLIAAGLTELLLPQFNLIAGKHLELDLLQPGPLPVFLLVLTVFVGLAAGSYPGWYLSSFRPVEVLKGKLVGGRQRPHLRNMLVVFQFTISIGLIICTLLVKRQMDFVRQTDLGFDKASLVVISNENGRLGNQAATYKDIIKSMAGVVNATISTGLPSYAGFQDFYEAEGKSEVRSDLISYLTDEDFLATLNLQLLKGRDFSKAFSTESDKVILNESAVRQFGWKDPLGKTLIYPGGDGRQFTVIGVIRDFNFDALYTPITPFALFHESSKSYSVPNSFVTVRVQPNDLDRTLAMLEKEWRTLAPGIPFEHTFLDENLGLQYRAEQRLGTVFLIFTGLAIFIACLGLLGLTSFTVERRTREIGIRKVLGASSPNIIKMLSTEFTKWVMVANILAWPVAWWAMNRWLQDFAYRIDISWWVFVLAGGLALGIALLTVSTQAVRAAVANPVDSLRYE